MPVSSSLWGMVGVEGEGEGGVASFGVRGGSFEALGTSRLTFRTFVIVDTCRGHSHYSLYVLK